MKKKWIGFALTLVLLLGLIPFKAVSVFAADESYTVSFNPGTGTGAMSQATVDAGGSYELPNCTFTHSNSERVFYKWSVEDELKDPGDTITVNADTTVTALWQYTKQVRIDNSVDRSTSEVMGNLYLTDTRTGNWRYWLHYDETTASAFTDPSNPTVQAMINEAKEAVREKAESEADGNAVTEVSITVSDPEIHRTKDNRTYTTFDKTKDEAGDYYSYLIIDGTYEHQWRYTVSLKAEYESDETPEHQGDQVQMWVGNTEVVGPDSSAQGGKVAVKYTPSYDDYPDIQAKDGTDYVAGEILQFYKGDECTVYAKADEGYRFIGWYHVNIAWAPGEDLAWEGSVISTESSFTYKPGETIIPGDTDPLRYVCAVFEKISDKAEPSSETPSESTNPQTGDEGHFGLWVGLMIISFVSFIIILIVRKKKLCFKKHTQ